MGSSTTAGREGCGGACAATKQARGRQGRVYNGVGGRPGRSRTGSRGENAELASYKGPGRGVFLPVFSRCGGGVGPPRGNTMDPIKKLRRGGLIPSRLLLSLLSPAPPLSLSLMLIRLPYFLSLFGGTTSPVPAPQPVKGREPLVISPDLGLTWQRGWPVGDILPELTCIGSV